MPLPPFNPADPSTYSSYVPTNAGGSSAPTNTPPAPPTAPTAPTTPSGFVGSSSSAKKQFAQSSGALAMAMQKFNLNGAQQGTGNNTESETPSDPFTVALDNLSKNQDNASKALIASIQAKAQQQKNDTANDYEDYKRGLFGLGIQHNEAQTTPELLQGRVQKIQNDFRAKISQIDAEETKALLDAENARDEKNLSVLKQKMDYVKQLKRDKLQALKDVYDQMNTEGNIAELQAEQIYDTMNSLGAADKEAFLIAVADKYNIPVPALVNALAKQKEAKAKKAGSGGSGSGGKFTTSQVESSMKAKTGEDGYIDPQAWVAARNRWLDTKSGSISTFNSLFKKYLNPESYSLAGFAK